jgi:hypothetical protein
MYYLNSNTETLAGLELNTTYGSIQRGLRAYAKVHKKRRTWRRPLAPPL